MTTTRLPLFPLSTVLFPGLVLPLNVFEARYRALVEELLKLPEDGPRPFGVIAIRDGHEVAPTALGLPEHVQPADPGPGAGFAANPMDSFFSVGCVADATTIRERGRGAGPAGPEDTGGGSGGTGGGPAARPVTGYDLLATGTSRFRLLSVDTEGPFLVGEVEMLPERTGEGAELLAAGVLGAFRAYQRQLAGAYDRTPAANRDLPEDPSVVSYLVAATTVLYPAERQRLLEAPDTAARLRQELELLRREVRLIRSLPSVPAADFTLRPTHLN
ncbi:LON peptidase substrate-binding domain-containing protein [Streptomyces sp. YIM 98790]|uniref:LON peptidase substrate-binding domain-containing protein n=1 Tax=Streptomyces sp. YIM 98790 TaxID=2689077 RepID=UPI00140B4F63|nr:LON peptidase substrate-binding domain-containing protein [Streptomyces sp. YIM 98790]